MAPTSKKPITIGKKILLEKVKIPNTCQDGRYCDEKGQALSGEKICALCKAAQEQENKRVGD